MLDLSELIGPALRTVWVSKESMVSCYQEIADKIVQERKGYG